MFPSISFMVFGFTFKFNDPCKFVYSTSYGLMFIYFCMWMSGFSTNAARTTNLYGITFAKSIGCKVWFYF